MPEYIEKEKLKEAFCPYSDTNYAQDMETILRIVDELPAADVAPVVHGRWIKTYEDCDLCHECSLCEKSALLDGNEREVLSPWCPNCGAKMDLE